MTLPLGIQRFIIAVVAILAGFVIALVSLSWLIDRTAVREAVRDQVRVTTGLDLLIGGSTSVAMFPASAVVFTDVAVAAADKDSAPALRMDELIVSLKLLPLFVGRYEIADLTLARPQISVTRDERGGNNWSSLLDTVAKTQASGSAASIPFSEVRIHDGVLSYRDTARASAEMIYDIDMSLAWPSISRSFAATGQLTWRDQRLDSSINLADFAAALSGRRSGIKVRMAGAPLKVAFDGAMTSDNGLTMEGTLTADSPSLRQTLRWSGQELTGNAGLGRFAMKGTASLKGGTLAITNANLELDGNAAEGVISYSRHDGRQTLQATLDSGALDLSPYVNSLRFLNIGSRDWERQPFDLRWLTGIDLDMRMSAARVTAGATRIGRTAFAANIHGGALTVSVGEAQMYGGIVRGSLDIKRNDGKADVRGQFQFTDVDLEACAGELFGFRKIAGRGNLNIMLDASGAHPFALAQTVDGTATLTGRSGALVGFNVEQLLRRLERRPLSGTGDYRSGRTPFDKLNVSIRLHDGIATTEDVSIEGPSVRLTMAGATSIPLREFDLKGTAALLPSAGAAPSFELPFVLQGPWDDPLLFPDSDSLIRRTPYGAPLLDAIDAVKDRRAREAVQAVRSAVERLRSQAAPAAQAPETPPQKTPPDTATPPAATETPATGSPVTTMEPASPGN